MGDGDGSGQGDRSPRPRPAHPRLVRPRFSKPIVLCGLVALLFLLDVVWIALLAGNGSFPSSAFFFSERGRWQWRRFSGGQAAADDESERKLSTADTLVFGERRQGGESDGWGLRHVIDRFGWGQGGTWEWNGREMAATTLTLPTVR